MANLFHFVMFVCIAGSHLGWTEAQEECATLQLVSSADDCKTPGLFRFPGDCNEYFNCTGNPGEGYHRVCDDDKIFNGVSDCIEKPEDQNSLKKICPQLKCGPEVDSRSRSDHTSPKPLTSTSTTSPRPTTSKSKSPSTGQVKSKTSRNQVFFLWIIFPALMQLI